MFFVCVDLVSSSKYLQFCIICILKCHININIVEVDCPLRFTVKWHSEIQEYTLLFNIWYFGEQLPREVLTGFRIYTRYTVHWTINESSAQVDMLHMLKIKPGTVEKNSSTIEIQPMPFHAITMFCLQGLQNRLPVVPGQLKC